jgi:hypothetical protein
MTSVDASPSGALSLIYSGMLVPGSSCRVSLVCLSLKEGNACAGGASMRESEVAVATAGVRIHLGSCASVDVRRCGVVSDEQAHSRQGAACGDARHHQVHLPELLEGGISKAGGQAADESQGSCAAVGRRPPPPCLQSALSSDFFGVRPRVPVALSSPSPALARPACASHPSPLPNHAPRLVLPLGCPPRAPPGWIRCCVVVASCALLPRPPSLSP